LISTDNKNDIIQKSEKCKTMNQDNIPKKLLSLKEMLTSLESFKPKIACTGLLNAGKSTLLNSLIGDMTNTVFATADIRETTDHQSYSINNLTYIDTPGLDANSEDTQKVYDVISSADIVLFVHNIKTGELDPSEVEFLINLQKKFKNSKSFLRTSIFVLTRKDELPEDREDIEIQEVTNKIKKQLSEIFNESANIISVSALVYQEAIKNNENLFLQYSNLSTLKKAIETLMVEYRDTMLEQKQHKFEIMLKDIKKELLNNRKELFSTKQKLLLENENSIENFKSDMRKFNDMLKQKEKNYKGL